MRYAVTGPTQLTNEQERLVADAVLLLRDEIEGDPGAEFTSGAAYGADTVAVAGAVAARFPLIRLTAPSGLWHNEALVADAARRTDRRWVITPCPLGYLSRNARTVSHADVLLAFPETAAEERRSGTWATIRRARRAGCEVRVSPLDGSAPWIEPSTRLAL